MHGLSGSPKQRIQILLEVRVFCMSLRFVNWIIDCTHCRSIHLTAIPATKNKAMVDALLSLVRHYCHTVTINRPCIRELQG